MEYGLGVDLGTTYTAAAVRVKDQLEIVQLGSQRAEIPSVVFVKTDGEMLIGDAADWRGDAEPDRLVREFKRRMGDPVSIMVAGTPYSAHMLTARVLRHVVDTVTRLQQAPPHAITVAHPANWTRFKRDFLGQAVHLAELDGVTFRTEPEAAALQYAATERIQPGETLAVYDLGGGTFDAAVLRKTGTGFELLGTPEGIEHLGGGDFDEAVLEHVTSTLGAAFAELDFDDDEVLVGLARLRRDCVRAKENLSFDTETTIQVALPGLHQRVRLNRSEFEAKIGPPLEQTVAAMRRALRSAGVEAGDLRCVLLTGGASRIPLVGQLLTAALDRPLALDAHPEHSVALGAALATGPATPEVAPEPTTPEPAEPEPSGIRAVATPTAPHPTEPATAKPKERAGIRRIAAAVNTRPGRIATAAAGVLAAAAVAGALWLPATPDHAAPQPSSSTSAPAGPVQLYAAAVQGPIDTAVGVDAARVYVVTGRTIQAMSRSDGAPAWPRPVTLPAVITSGPVLSGDTVYVPARDNRLHALDATDGRELWHIPTGEKDPGPPSVAGKAIYFGTYGGLVSRYRLPDRKRQWRYQTGNGVLHPPAVAEGTVVVNSSDGRLHAFDAENGNQRRWFLDIKPSSTPVIAGGQVFVGCEDRKIHAIDVQTHATNWTFATGAVVESTPAVGGALVYVGGKDGIVYAVDAAAGGERWRFRGAAGDQFGSAEFADGVVYVATRSAKIYALDAATGRQLWKHDVEGTPGPLRVVGGVLYVGTSAKVLYAFRVGAAPPPGPVGTSATPSRRVPTEPGPTPSPQRTHQPPRNEPRPTKHGTRKPTTTTRPTTSPTPTPTITEPTTTPTTPTEPGVG